MHGPATLLVLLAFLIGACAEIDVKERRFLGRPFLIGGLNRQPDLLGLDVSSMGDNACWKHVQERGAGTLPSACDGQHELTGHRCYPSCKDGYTGDGATCWMPCPEGFQVK